MLFGIADRLLHRLEMVQRSAARVVMQIRRGDRQSMTTILQRLHWLPVKKYGAPFSHLFTELKISQIEVHISAIELEISPIELNISAIELQISPNRPI